MKKLFEQYGGVITTVIAIVALIGIISLTIAGPNGGWIGGAFQDVISKFSQTANSKIDGGYQMLDGDGAVLNLAEPTQLSFRSSAPVDKFKEVRIDGEVVDASNYTVTEGSTIITFNDDYFEDKDRGNKSIEIVSNDGSASGVFTVTYEHNTIIPDGSTYIIYSTGEVLESGSNMPSEPSVGDVYVLSDYEYCYNYCWCPDDISWSIDCGCEIVSDGWAVKYLGSDEYPLPMLDTLNGKPVVSMCNAFVELDFIICSPVIPNSITDMTRAFEFCDSLEVVPNLPDTLVNMEDSFASCKSLTDVPTIPDSVKNMKGTFSGCTSLTETPNIPNNVEIIRNIFAGCYSLTEIPKIPSHITDWSGIFSKWSFTEAPEIPDGVTNLNGTFSNCKNLTTAPIIPNSVTNMYCTFDGCTSLTTAPVIPNSVTNMQQTFQDCTSLTDTVTINTNPTAYIKCFGNVDFATQNLTLTGSSTMLAQLGATGTNYSN